MTPCIFLRFRPTTLRLPRPPSRFSATGPTQYPSTRRRSSWNGTLCWRSGACLRGFSSRLQDGLLQLLFGSSLYSQRAPIGLPEVVETAPGQLLRDFYERWYRPDLMAVVAVGDFDVDSDRSQGETALCAAAGGRGSTRSAPLSRPPPRWPGIDIPGHEAPWIEVFTDAESPGTQFVLDPQAGP